MQIRSPAMQTPASAVPAGAEPGQVARDAIVLLTSRLGMGGAERHTITLANTLGGDFRVVMAYLKPDEDMIEQIERERVVELRCLHAARRIDLRAARELLSLAQAHRARVIVCANAFALMYAQLARWLSPTPIAVVEVFHTTKLRTLKEHLEMVFYRPFFWAAHHLVFVCAGQRQHWRRRAVGGMRTHMIYNGVDLAHFDPARFASGIGATRLALDFAATDRVVGICAVLRPEKAHLDLLAAVARRRLEGERWKVLIIGDGPLREVIERDVARLGLSGEVRITGFQSDVREWLMACDVVALPSTAIETFSIAALEAMSMGKPMIMSDIGGAREQVEHGVHGMLFPPGDAAVLAMCLRHCWDLAVTKRMGVAARTRVEREFSLQTMIGRYGSLFRSILDASSQGSRIVGG